MVRMNSVVFLMCLCNIISFVAGDKREVVHCTVPCTHITVNSKKVRDVFVTSCVLNRVFVNGDASQVQIFALKDKKVCGK